MKDSARLGIGIVDWRFGLRIQDERSAISDCTPAAGRCRSRISAYVTAQRTGEIGIRMALGADRTDVRRLVLADTLRLVVIGVVIGLPAALAGARLLESQLYGIKPADPLALAVGLTTLVAASVAAGYLPARRAVRVDPCRALRAE